MTEHVTEMNLFKPDGSFSHTVYVNGGQAVINRAVTELENVGYLVRVGATERAKVWEVQCPICKEFTHVTKQSYGKKQLEQKGVKLVKGKVRLICATCRFDYTRSDIKLEEAE